MHVVMTHKRAHQRIIGPGHETRMTATRWFLGSLLILVVLIVLVVAGGIGLPGSWGLQREASETSPSPQTTAQ